jgi:hypothetical protein
MTTSAVGTYGSLPSNNSGVNYGAGAVQPNTTGTPINNIANKIVIPTITVDADKEISFGSYAMTGGNAVTIDDSGNINVDHGYGLVIDGENTNKIRIDLGVGDWCNAAGQGLYWASNDTFGCTTPYSWKVSATGSNTSTIAHDGTVTFAHGTGLTVSQASGIVTYGLSISGLDTATGICGADQRLTFGLMDDGVSYGFLCSYTLVASDGTTITNSGGSVSLATCSVGQVFKMVKTTGGSTRWQCSYQAEMRYVFWGDEGLGGSCEPQISINTRSRCRVTYQDWDHNKIPLPYDPSYIAVVDVVGSGTPTAADCVADVDGADKEKVTVFCEYEMDNIKVSYGSGSTISYWDQYDAAGNGNTKETSAPSISVEHGDHWAEPGALVVIAYP